jgi:hypothetical protein
MRSTERSTSPRRALLRLAPAALAASLLQAQRGADNEPMPAPTPTTSAILKAEYEQNVKDARELTALAKSIELDFDKNDQNVLSIALLKKLDDVDKITKRIRGRMRR